MPCKTDMDVLILTEYQQTLGLINNSAKLANNVF
jgi:hypothetical protein